MIIEFNPKHNLTKFKVVLKTEIGSSIYDIEADDIGLAETIATKRFVEDYGITATFDIIDFIIEGPQ